MTRLMNTRQRLMDLSERIKKVTIREPEKMQRGGFCPLSRRCEAGGGVIDANEILPILKDLIECFDYITDPQKRQIIVEIPEGYALDIVKLDDKQ